MSLPSPVIFRLLVTLMFWELKDLFRLPLASDGSNGFQTTLGDFLADMACIFADTLVSLWNLELIWVINPGFPRCSVLLVRIISAPLFSRELGNQLAD